MRSDLIGLSVLLLSCCSLRADQRPDPPTQDVTYCQLASNPASFSGKRVRVRAIYSFMFEVSRLQPPEFCPERGPGIWVDFEEDDMDRYSKRLAHKLDKLGMGDALVVFEGKFEGGRTYGTFGERFRLLVGKIEKIEATSRSPKPAWKPHNCGGTVALQ